MLSAAGLREEWRARARLRPLYPMMSLSEDGLVLGTATVLASRRASSEGLPKLALDGAEERVLALLAMAYRRPVGPRVLGNIRRAAAAWDRGETVFADIHLALSGLPRLPDEDAPFRLFAAERALASGIAPRDLLKACGLDTGPLDLMKAGYNPDEPGVPAGNPDGGEWTAGGAEPKTPTAPRERFEPVNFTPVHRLPNDAVVVIPPDGKSIADPDSPTKKLMAPPHADFRQVYAAGRSIAELSYSEQYRRARAAIAQGGTFDFQRDVSQQKFYHPYIHAANYAVGVYMAGAGYSLPVTLALAKLYAFGNSSNYNVQERTGSDAAGMMPIPVGGDSAFPQTWHNLL